MLRAAKAFFGHDAFDVFDDDDGVVDEKADRQHHGEHRQGIDRVAGDRQHPEGAEQHHGNGNRRDQRRTKILQEDEQHHEDEHDRFDQRVDNFLDRQFHEGCRVIGIGDLHARRQATADNLKRGAHAGGGIDGVGADRKVDGKTG